MEVQLENSSPLRVLLKRIELRAIGRVEQGEFFSYIPELN